jgi:hypothetical protein
VANNSAYDPRRVGWLRDELEAGCRIPRRPPDGGAGLEEFALEVHRFIANPSAVEDTAPFHLEIHLGYLRKARRKNLGQRALQIVIVRNLRPEPERRFAGAQVDFNAIARHGYCPEYAVRIDMRVVVMNLIRSNWTVKDVQSDEPERALIMLAVDRDIHPIHEPHISLVRQRWEPRARADS